MKIYLKVVLLFMFGITICCGEESSSIKAKWEMPPSCTPFDPPRISDLKEELRKTGYRLVIAIRPENPDESKGESISRDLYIVNADGTGLKRLTNTPDKDETRPRVSPNGKLFTYDAGKYLVDVKTLKTKQINGGPTWTPDSKRTVNWDGRGIFFIDIETGERSQPIPCEQKVGNVDMSSDSKWFIFEIRDYLGKPYTIDFISSSGGKIRKMPNHPPVKGKGEGECHPALSPDGKWMCWNTEATLAIRKFDPTLPDGTDEKIIDLPCGEDPCGRWSHCGRYIAYVKHKAWRVPDSLYIMRIVDKETIMISPEGWVGHHWDYDWLPPEDLENK